MIKVYLAALVLVFAAIFSVQVVLCQTDGGQGASLDVPPPSPSTASSGGGGHRQIDFDKILKALQEGKQRKPDKFDELKKLLYIEPFVTKDYDKNLSLGLSVSGNKTKTRNDKFIIIASVANPNPPEVRRVLFLSLEVLEPGEKEFRKVNSLPVMILNNEYQENDRGQNISSRIFPELTSFGNLMTVGPAVLRLYVTDGQYNWQYPLKGSEDFILNIINRPPSLENITLQTPEPRPRFKDPIIYMANVTDEDSDLVNVTLHILDEQGQEKRNATQQIKGSGPIAFKANEYGFFGEDDAGKNFTYYYSIDDGINVSNTKNQTGQIGPCIRRGPKLYVDRLDFTAESGSHYWWQRYTFSLRVKNLNPEKYDVGFTLYTNTKSNPLTYVDSKTVTVGAESQVIYFNQTRPFMVTDANETFSYRINYSEYDQRGMDSIEDIGVSINPKIVPYAIFSPVIVANLMAMFLLILGTGLFIERIFKRGIEAQESSSNASARRKQGSSKSRGGNFRKIFAWLKRRG